MYRQIRIHNYIHMYTQIHYTYIHYIYYIHIHTSHTVHTYTYIHRMYLCTYGICTPLQLQPTVHTCVHSRQYTLVYAHAYIVHIVYATTLYTQYLIQHAHIYTPLLYTHAYIYHSYIAHCIIQSCYMHSCYMCPRSIYALVIARLYITTPHIWHTQDTYKHIDIQGINRPIII